MNNQQQFIQAIWSDSAAIKQYSIAEQQGINVYRRNLMASASRSLSISFPTVYLLLDSDIAEIVTEQFLSYSPPTEGDWAQWGEEFPAFIATTEVGNSYPYLADCAALDWATHLALHGVDQTLQQASLQLLGTGDPEQLYIQLNDNVKLISSQYPITDIYTAHHHEKMSQQVVSMSKAKAALKLNNEMQQTVMVYRPLFQPKVRTLTSGEATFTQTIMSGNSLAQSLDSVSEDKNFSFENWLLFAIENNLIYIIEEK